MTKLLQGILPLLFLASAHAQTAAANPPADETNPIGTIIFLVLFVGFCVGIVWLIWRNEKNPVVVEKGEQGQHGAAGPSA